MSLPWLVRSRPNRTRDTAAPKRPQGARRACRVLLGVEELEPRILLAGAAFRLPVLPPASAPFHVVGHSRRAAGAAELGGLFQVPGQPGQSVAVRFSYTLRDAAFRNELGMFLVDDAQGHIGRLKPGEPGYAAAALSRARGLVLFSRGQAPGASRTLELPAGQFFGLYLIQNATTAQFLAHNPRNRPGRGPVAFFSLVRANPDRFQHLRRLPGFRFGFEDSLGGGDRDFNDLVTRVEFGPPQGIAAPPPGPPSPMTAASPAPAKPRIPPGVTARLSDDTAPGGTTNADGITSDPAVEGTVTASAAVTSLRAGFDAAPAAAFVDVTAALQPGGTFTLDRARLTQADGGSLPDGPHTLHLSVTDADGGTGAFDLPFTLDTTPPAVDFHLDPAFDTPPAGDGHTQEAVVTLAGTTEPNTPVVLQETGARTTSDPATGAFSFPGVALTLGDNVFTVQAIDPAGNAGTARHTITRDAALVSTTLVEGSRFLTPLEQSIVVPAQPSKLEFRFSNLNFDTRADFIKDAFEASLTDANGNPLVLPVAGTRDAFLNITEGQAPVLSPNAQLTGDTVDVDLSQIPAGTQARLRVRLVNNDADTTTSVLVDEAQVIPAAMDTPGAVTPAAAATAARSAVDFSALSDVTASMTATYGETSLDEKSAVLYAGLALKNTGGYPVDAPLVVAIAHLSDPSVRVRGDGTTPDGLPYFVLDGSAGSTLTPGQATAARTLAFFDPKGIPFTYDVVVLGQLNRPPAFTSQPNAEAIPGLPYVYQAAATDPDNDALTYSLLAGPAGMAVDPASGKVTWSPQQSDLGNETVLLQVDDGHGGTARQPYTVSVIAAPPNRPPVFTSTPVVDANVNTPYTYQATATDADGDPLSYSFNYALEAPPVPVAVTDPSFETSVLGEGSSNDILPGWTITGPAATGTFNPLPGDFPAGLPDGQNVAFSNGGTIAQVLTERLTAGTRYTLQVDVGHRSNLDLAPFSVELWAGGLLAAAAAPVPAAGSFATVTVSYDAPANSPFLGQPLEIRLISSGVQVCFDNVRLTAAGVPGLVVDSATGLLTWTPSGDQRGPQFVAVQADDGRGGVALQTFTVNVLDLSNHAPAIVSQPITAAETPLPAPNRPLHTLDFEGLPAAPSFSEGTTIPAGDTLSDHFLPTDGVTFRSDSGVPYIAVVTLGTGHATSGTNGIGGMRTSTILDYATPIVGEFFLPNDPTTPAATDFVSIRADNVGAAGAVILEGYDANGVLLATTSAPDVGGETLTLATPGIHSIKIRGTTTTAFDDLTFAEVYADPAYHYDVDAVDPDHDAITYSLTTAPAGMAIDATTGLITWFPPPVVASYPVTVRADDGRGAFDTQSFNVVVNQAGAGQIDGTAFNDLDGSGGRDPQEPGLPGRLIYLDLNQNGIHDAGEPSVTTDANGDYSFINVTPGVYAVALEGQPGSRQTLPRDGAYSITVPLGATVSGVDFGATPFTSGARPPTITSTAPTVAAVGQPYRYAVSVNNPDGVALQFDLSLAPDGMTVDPGTGVITWTPALSQVGSQEAIVRLRDARGDVVLQAFQVNVTVEAAPIITSTPPNPATTLLPYRYQVEAQDAENDPLTYSLLEGPVGMTIDSGTGVISWVGAAIGPGLPARFPVTVMVSNGRGGQDTQSYTLLDVADAGDQAPVINSPPATSVALGHTYLYAVLATDPDGDPLAYDLPTAPAGMTIGTDGLIRWTPTAAQFGPNGVTVRVQDGRGGTATQAFTINVTAQPSDRPPRITSTPSLAATVGRGYIYDATGTDPDGSPLVWDLEAAPSGMSINPRRGTIRWTPTADQLGSQQVVIRLTNGEGLSVTQTFAVQVRATDVPPLITSTPPTQGGAGQTYTYAVDATDVDGDPLTYRLTAFPAGMTIDATTGLIQWTPTADQVGPHVVAVAVDDGQGGTATQAWGVIVSSTPINHAPVITSTPPPAPPSGMPYQYQVVATDPDGQSVRFSFAVAPDGMTIDPSSGLVQWTPTAAQVGTNQVTVAATDPQGLSAVQTFSIVVTAVNRPPAINSTPPAAVMVGQTYHYDVAATDPDGDPLSYTLTSAPAGMTIDPLGRITWSPGTADVGGHDAEVKVEDGRGGFATQQFTVTAGVDAEAPQVLLSLSANPADLGSTVTAIVTATDNVGVTSLGLTLDGTPVVLDAMGRATLPAATVGIFTLVARATDAAGLTGTDSQSLVVRDPHVTGAPVVDLTTPADGDTITAPTQVIGTVQDPNLLSYTLSVAPLGSDSFTTLFTGTNQVADGVLGTLDPTILQNGAYDLRLTATNTGGLVSTVDVTVNITENLKLGNFRLSFTDLTIPLSGIPINVSRTYDTLTANDSEDFGFGWRLEYRDVDLQTSVPTTDGQDDGFFNPFKVNTHVYLTLPGGQREGFTFQPAVADGMQGQFLGIFVPKFVPDPGVTSTLTVADASLRIDSDGTVSDYSTGLAYNPASPDFGGFYLLTTNAGIAYTVDAFTGQLTNVTDPTGNALTFSDSGITSSTGVSVRFERDPQGRINAVVDPMGHRLLYQYDGNGDLVSFTDQAGDKTTYVYRSSPAHYLDQVIDPLGHTGVRTDYDDQGRLVRIIDGMGNPVQLAYDPTHLVESVTDPLGGVSLEEFDARGNTLSKTDALGNVTRMTYDANNNMLTLTDPLGQTTSYTYDDRGDALTLTDPLGHVTVSTFQAFTFGTGTGAAVNGQAAPPFTRPTTVTDPLGNTTSYGYDFFGNPTTLTDPLGRTTSETLDGVGNRTSLTDRDGNTTHTVFDGAGNVVVQTDALGNAAVFTYDANGDRLTSTATRTDADGTVHTLTTSMTYDAKGRVVAVTDPMGGVTRTEYDAAGNKTATVDALGNRTAYVYDADNRLIATIYPDATPDDPADNPRTQNAYDAAGRLVATTDELGRRTQFVYDADGRLVKTLLPDGTFTATVYDADGRTISEVHQGGGAAATVYDAAGNTVMTTDALGNKTQITLNAADQETAETDARGNTTAKVHDADGRLVETDNPDGTTSTVTLDAVGRVLSRTDALGRTTSYQYDANGRVLQITDPLGNKTSYTYDELGNELTESQTQTAADGSVRTLTTTKSYDDLGRLIAVTDPEGGVTRTEYDAQGNVTARVDALGKRTAYVYDPQNRLVETIYPDDTPADPSDNPRTTIEYDAAGQQTATVDELGRRTTYQYDPQGRLVKTVYPDGSSTQQEYNDQGQVSASVDERGNLTEYQYDANGNTVQVTDALAGTVRATYDALGQLVSQTDALGHTTRFVYDVMERLTETDYADGTKTTDTYDAAGQLIATTDQLGRTTHYEYDADGRRTAVIDPLGQKTQYAYDEEGNLIRLTDANGNVTVYTYDGLGRRVATFLPSLPGQAAFESSTAYDADGNVVSTTDFNGNTIHFAYDARDRLLAKNYPDGTSVTYTYTLTGQTATVTDTRGTTAYTYDQRDRLLTCTEPDGTVLANAYDAAGDRTSVTTPAGTTSYTFDALGRQLTVTDPNGGVTRYTYDAAGNLTRTDLPNGVTETRSYDTLNRLTFLQDASPSGVIASYAYTLGPTGLRDEVVENSGRTVDYTYDALDRLTQEKITDAVFGNRTIDYTYDAAGNRLTMDDSVDGSTVYTYDAMNRLTTSTHAGQLTSYTYDKNGNTLSQVSATDAVFYQYDFDNRLIAADTNGDGTAEERNSYDPAGNLVSQTVSGQETRFLIDTVRQYADVVMEYQPGGSVTASYVYGNGLISQVRGGVRSFYLVDGLGSTRQLADSAGKVTDQYLYDAFGRVLFQSGGTVNRYQFAGEPADGTLGLDYLRARYYNPALGAFTTADPLRGSVTAPGRLQVYAYAGSNPVNNTDPSGKDFLGLSDFTIAQGVAGLIQGAIAGYESGGFKGAFIGAFVGLFAGLTLGVFGQGLVQAGVGAGVAIGTSIQVSAQAFALAATASSTVQYVTAKSDQEREGAAIGLLFQLGTGLPELVPAPAEEPLPIPAAAPAEPTYTFSGGSTEYIQKIGQTIANKLKVNIVKYNEILNYYIDSFQIEGSGKRVDIISPGDRRYAQDALVVLARSNADVKALVFKTGQLTPVSLDYIKSFASNPRGALRNTVLIYETDGNGFSLVDEFESGNYILPPLGSPNGPPLGKPGGRSNVNDPGTPPASGFDAFGDTPPAG